MIQVTNILWVVSAFVVSQSAGFPRKIFYSDLDTAPSYMLEAGYYRKPTFRQNYYPGSLSAVVTKDLVASNSFAGTPQYYPSFDDNDSKEYYTERNPVAHGNIPNKNPELSLEEDTKGGSNFHDNGNVNTPKRQGKKPVKNDDDDEEDSPWPFEKAGPSYTAFFPINLSGSGSSSHRTRNAGNGQDEVPYAPSGSATAIANAFSTGKGGIANSRATSFGDPNLAAMFLRSGMNNVKGYKEY